jgi:hypothetical protein
MKDGPRYYRVSKTGRARWEPTAAMRARGFKTKQLGPDGDLARAKAEALSAEWDVVRRGHKASDETIVAAGFRLDDAEGLRAEVTLEQIEALARRFEYSAAASYLVKGLREIARGLDRAAKLAAADAVPRDILRVASA